MAPGAVHYIPGESCTFTIWPLPGSGSATSPGAGAGNRRSVMIRLQFEYLDLGPGDTLNIYSNGLDGPKILSIAGSGLGIVNRTITSRSSSVVLRLHAEGPVGGTGFRVYWRVIESSPLDIYLISAIIAKVLNGDLSGVDAPDDHGSRSMIGAMESLGRQDMAKRSSDSTPISTHEHIPTYANATYPVTSILTCILCSCCCNNCVAMFSGAGGGRRGGRLLWAWGGANASAPAARALSPQEKARLPIAPYDPGESNLYNFRECCICLTDFERTDLVRKLPCGHVYHSECVDCWFSVNSVCPLCKSDVRDKLGVGAEGAGMVPFWRMRAALHLIQRRLLWPAGHLLHLHRPPPHGSALSFPGNREAEGGRGSGSGRRWLSSRGWLGGDRGVLSIDWQPRAPTAEREGEERWPRWDQGGEQNVRGEEVVVFEFAPGGAERGGRAVEEGGRGEEGGHGWGVNEGNRGGDTAGVDLERGDVDNRAGGGREGEEDGRGREETGLRVPQ
ncbi:atp synthetase alpha chain -like protein [Nannochloropsis gaditana CCMP526]|uniref:atp synthetase alpha chain -like protein n=1 Tax=Nannochloropsis gaditana (strain CCMP526) TaxID=1093141 RepID=UPI00029F6EF1|nr:atp synthetase alpha chain -like protein [Nannochloropsis gaditana CCMP526]XP_005854824.1 atp synthetase alpha chain -like protein [Nannochloropsis gaditana CCMP526]EKU21536.1 atp synthetase alpha chain -like protein [Nannochloropsis gaditana CCMP526]EKU21577.1 atp synthetase alpha chain -like protein [Nannochloropsis gaditana CCMP526]|eukprot:XP_005854788.1 atp synthetase alpha chain -like protein [Nannochloropsis gaditana CCMP526]